MPNSTRIALIQEQQGTVNPRTKESKMNSTQEQQTKEQELSSTRKALPERTSPKSRKMKTDELPKNKKTAMFMKPPSKTREPHSRPRTERS